MKTNSVFASAMFAFGIWALAACQTKTPEQLAEQPVVKSDYRASIAQLSPQQLDSAAVLVADSIVYDVVVRNPAPNDDWVEYCLRGVDEQSMAHLIIEEVLKGRLKAYSYSTNAPLSIDDVKAIEKGEGNGRDNVAKVQFEEKWYFDVANLQFVKRVYAVMLAYEINGAEGRYRAGIKVYLPEPKTETKLVVADSTNLQQ